MKARNMLSFPQKYELAKWMNKHLDWCASKGMTVEETASKASNELGFPITPANLRGLWVREMAKTWPFKHGGSRGDGRPSVSSLKAENRAIAKALVDLYGRLGSMQDCNPEVRHIAGVELEGGA